MYDIIVIGGGPAGYMAALQAARLGVKTAIIEQDTLGGTCLNRGCIPTKYYLKSSELLFSLKQAGERGITIAPDAVQVDMKKARKGKDKVVRRLTGGVKSLLTSSDVEIISGSAAALNAHEVMVDGSRKLTAGAIIAAGGSKVGSIPVPGIDSPRVLSSDDLLDIETIPESLVIIGGGVIGVEMSMIFSALGTEVTVIEMEERILPFLDRELSDVLVSSMKKKGITVRAGVRLSRLEEGADSITAVLSDTSHITGTYALLSIGRRADLSALEQCAVHIDRQVVQVNERMESSVPGIYAPGDVNGQKMLAHAAYHMGEIAAWNAVQYVSGTPQQYRDVDLSRVPSVVYSIPEIASAGLQEAELRAAGREISIGRFSLSANGRALAGGEPEGFVKVIADARYGEILGVQIAGHNASEIINEAVLAMSMEITVHELADTMHAHPSVSEALKEAAADCLGRSMHLPAKA